MSDEPHTPVENAHRDMLAGAALAAQRAAEAVPYVLNPVQFFGFRAIYWERQPPSTPARVTTVTELAKLFGAIFNGGVTAISFLQNAESPRARLNVEISLPADITYDDVMANLQRLAGEHSSAAVLPSTGRRRLLKLEKTT